MQTMHLVLPVGAFDWENNPLPEDEFHVRITAVQEIMGQNDWSGVLVYGDIHDNGLLSYVSNFGARLSGALVLIPKNGEPRLLSFDGGRMVPAGALTTWIKDVRAAGIVDVAVNEWLDELPHSTRLAVAGFDIMSAAVHDKLAAVEEIANAENGTSHLQELARKKSDAEMAVIKTACGVLRDVENAVSAKQKAGGSAAECTLVAEKTARNLGAQDVRTLFSIDGGRTFIPFQGLSDKTPDPFVIYVAVRVRSYWADGFMTFPVKSVQALDAMIANAKPGASAGDLLAANNSAHPFIGDDPGCGIGCALEEPPFLNEGATLNAGDVVSLKVSIGGDVPALASAIVRITNQGNDVLWRAGE